jgi:predicted DsbA family dithiol-disulfide isomerase
LNLDMDGGGWMTQDGGELERFFREYERYANLGDAEGTASLFAEVFLAADPAGARAVSAAQLGAGVSQRKKLLESLGSRSTELISLEQRTLDDRYVLATTKWKVGFDREEMKELMLESSFVVHRSEAGPRIVFYLAHQSLMDVLKERGLLPIGKT